MCSPLHVAADGVDSGNQGTSGCPIANAEGYLLGYNAQ